LELLFRDGLIDSNIFIGSDRDVSIGVEFNGSLREDSTGSFLFFISSELKIIKDLIPIQQFVLDWHRQLCLLEDTQI
jgi:hypothetical protein